MKRINLPKNKRARLCRTFGTSGVTVWSALNYVTNSPLAEKIRRAAIAEGGVVENQLTVPEGFMPNCETNFVHEDGGVRRIIQTFSNGVRLEFDSDTSVADISRNGRLVKTYSDVKVRDWGNIVFEAQSLTDSLNQ